MDADVQDQVDTEGGGDAGTPAPPLQMATVRPGEMRIGPTLNDVVEKIALNEGQEPDEALEAAGWERHHEWRQDGAGPWTLVAKI